MPLINVIASCTSRKTSPPETACRMARIRSIKTETRLAEWVRRISKARGDSKRAIDLYCGDHWHVLRKLVETQNTPKKFDLWVASAGWGLINSEAEITSYGATFSHLDPDSVIHPNILPQESHLWWNGLTQSRLQGRKSPSSFAALAKKTPTVPMLVALPPSYLTAVRDDLILARSLLATPDLLVVVSAGTKRDADFSSNLVPCDSRLQTLLGGSLTSLNARIARYILENYPPRKLLASPIIRHFEKLTSQSQKQSPPKRAIKTDSEIADFISKKLSCKKTKHSHSSLLRVFRDSGKACEQSRFSRIFRSVIQSRNQNEETE